MDAINVRQIDSIYDAIIDLAKEAGEIQKASFRSEFLSVSTKSTDVDMVTEIDLACDRLIVDRIRTLFPEDVILSEEQGYAPLHGEKSGYSWIIDPLDGTTNYSIGHPIFAVSIARWCGDIPEFGVVYIPMLDELYYAQRGKGSFCNRKRLSASNKTALNQSVLATGFPYDRATCVNNNSENVAKMIPKVKGIRRLGAAAYDLCLVAAGVYDGYWELRLGKWDMAAGYLMILESGGVCDFTEEEGKFNLVAGAYDICVQIKEIVNLTN